jgi:hypothetical protein
MNPETFYERIKIDFSGTRLRSDFSLEEKGKNPSPTGRGRRVRENMSVNLKEMRD